MKRFFLMHFKITLITLVVFVGLTSFCQQLQGIPTGKENVDVVNPILEREILDLVNEIRIKKNLTPLVQQNDLARAARYHAKDMALDDYVEHFSFDRKGNQLIKQCETFVRIERFISMNYLGENIAAGKATAKETVDGWMKSKGHRENILNPNFKYLGVGYYYKSSSLYKHYWVQDFGG